ncbi:MAG: hypothetical protein IBJ12_05895 [Sphingomonadaceae bacterium]|nr:hypothetical protein [Sphingomonadaceae bacterium]
MMSKWDVDLSEPTIGAFVKYATAFEKSFVTRDWSDVDACLTDNAIWTVDGGKPPVAASYKGRGSVIEAIRYAVDHYDRRFTVRAPQSPGPTLIAGRGIYLPWQITFQQPGLPDFILTGEEWDLFEDGKLCMHFERIHNADEIDAYIAQHDAQLVPLG